ncbi:MAG: SDR family oxidoreductase [Fuerstiella sp.]|nr:SDR family oxidoreductase [Fuerstiella sp.]MCP4858071.1 SDR family oxidoreductase [Fuerstiella sp.]
MELRLKESVVVVVGGASGIGKACAQAFVREGARVAVWDVSAEVATLAEHPSIDGWTVDIADETAVQSAVSATESRIGPIQHLVHAAAVGSGKLGFPFTRLQPSDWSRVLEVNVSGMVNVAHAIAPGMAERCAGTMVFVASVAGQIGSPTDPPYSASKAANINFAQVMARDLASSGVRVNTVCPGMVKTPLNQSVWKSWNDRQGPSQQLGYDEWAAEKIRQLVPLGRWQQPEDVADMIVFLSSARAAQVTGQTINVDGGYVMHS